MCVWTECGVWDRPTQYKNSQYRSSQDVSDISFFSNAGRESQESIQEVVAFREVLLLEIDAYRNGIFNYLVPPKFQEKYYF